MPRLQFKNQQSHKEHLVILIYFFLIQNIKKKKKEKSDYILLADRPTTFLKY